jgi:hypothetical protein
MHPVVTTAWPVGAATLLLFASLWSLLPAANLPLLWLAVRVPELSPLLLGGVARRPSPSRSCTRATTIAAVATRRAEDGWAHLVL